MQDDSQNIERRPRRRDRGLTGGLILILLGVIFLAEQTGWFVLRNWWALFILIPAFGNFATAYALYRRSGRFTQAVRGSVFSGAIVLAVALMFLVDLSWTVFWPLFILLPGLAILSAGLPLANEQSHVAGLFAGSWLVFTGLGAILLGLGFLAQNLGWFYPMEIMPRWWAICILFPALGGLIASVRLYGTYHAPTAALSSLVAAAIVGAVGIFALLGLDWNLLWPVALIAGGGVLLLGTLGNRRAA